MKLQEGHAWLEGEMGSWWREMESGYNHISLDAGMKILRIKKNYNYKNAWGKRAHIFITQYYYAMLIYCNNILFY